jgi:uncharacterized protein YcfL
MNEHITKPDDDSQRSPWPPLVQFVYWKLLGLLLGVSLISLMTACSTQSTPPLTEKQLMTVRMGDTSAVEVIDMRSVVRNNILTAQVTVKNWGPPPDKKTGEPVPDNKLYGYRFKWLNANGMVVFTDEAWKPLTLTRDQSADLVGVAPTPEATAFRFEINQYK